MSDDKKKRCCSLADMAGTMRSPLGPVKVPSELLDYLEPVVDEDGSVRQRRSLFGVVYEEVLPKDLMFEHEITKVEPMKGPLGMAFYDYDYSPIGEDDEH
jgi:hypothetical protein